MQISEINMIKRWYNMLAMCDYTYSGWSGEDDATSCQPVHCHLLKISRQWIRQRSFISSGRIFAENEFYKAEVSLLLCTTVLATSSL